MIQDFLLNNSCFTENKSHNIKKYLKILIDILHILNLKLLIFL